MMQKRIGLGNATLLAAALLLLWFASAAAEQPETATLACESFDHQMFVSFVINFTAGGMLQTTQDRLAVRLGHLI